MATLGAGMAGGFAPLTGSESSRIHICDDGGGGGEANATYRVVFSRRAYMQRLNQNKIREHQYLAMRQQARRRRKLLEEQDEYKRLANRIQPYALAATLAGVLLSCCGFVDEWARTSPIGDLSHYQTRLRISGAATLACGLLLQTSSHLLYYYNETGTLSAPTVSGKTVSVSEVRRRKPVPSRAERQRRYSSLAFYFAAAMLVASSLAFCTGYVDEWYEQAPVKLPAGSKEIIGMLGIVGVTVSVAMLGCVDLWTAWLDSQAFQRRRETVYKEAATRRWVVPDLVITAASEREDASAGEENSAGSASRESWRVEAVADGNIPDNGESRPNTAENQGAVDGLSELTVHVADN